MDLTLKLENDAPGIGRSGQVVKLTLAPTDVMHPTELATYLAGYKPMAYRADEASPPILVDKDEGKLRNFSSDDAFRRVDVKSSMNAAVDEVDPKSSFIDYKVVDKFIGSFIPDPVEQNATQLYRPRQAALRRCRRAIELDREIDVWGALTTSSNWASANVATLGAGAQWNGGASSDPIKDLQTRIEASAQPVTSIFFNEQVKNAFLRHALVRDHMRQMLGDRGAEQLADMEDFKIPGLPPFRTSMSKVKNESTLALDYVLNDSIVLLCQVPGTPTDGEEISTSYSPRRRGPAGVGFGTREYRVEGRGPQGGTMVVAHAADIFVMTGNNCGGLILDAIQ